jgi:hypothetical protein
MHVSSQAYPAPVRRRPYGSARLVPAGGIRTGTRGNEYVSKDKHFGRYGTLPP